MPAPARNRQFRMSYRFQVIVDGFTSFAFKACTGLEMTVAVATYGEGGAMAPMKEPAKADFSNVTLTRGVGLNTEMWYWMLDCVDMGSKLPIGVGAKFADLAKTVTIAEMDRKAVDVVYWDLYSAFPVRYKPGEWDFDSDDVNIEELEIAYWYFDRKTS